MNNQTRFNQNRQLSHDFFHSVPDHAMHDPYELIGFWRQALDFRGRFPHLQEDVAIFAVSIGSGSRLTNDNDIFEAVHAQFGALEMQQGIKSDEGWARVAILIDQAERNSKSKK